MKLSERQLNEIKKACESIEYGAVTIKLNGTEKFVDIIIENRVRLQSESTINTAPPKGGRF